MNKASFIWCNHVAFQLQLNHSCLCASDTTDIIQKKCNVVQRKIPQHSSLKCQLSETAQNGK